MGAHQSNRPANRLIHEPSPYLQQHAYNPVDWHPWGEEAFAKAKAGNKLVLGSVGYSSCHWCHVMARECFADEAIAGPDALPLRRAFGTHPVPKTLLFPGMTTGTLPHLQRRSLPSSTIFVCVDQACQLPVATVDEALNQLP